MKKIILYGISLSLLTLVLKTVEYRFMIMDHAVEIYGGIVAAIFTAFGIWLSAKITKPKKEIVVVEKMVFPPLASFVTNVEALKTHGISQRELEVLELIA